MTSAKVYHGTITGKDDIFLEKFVITGACFDAAKDTSLGQGGGFYISLDPSTAKLFSHTTAPEDAVRRGHAQDPLRHGRGMIVEIDAQLNAREWDFDHEMSFGLSLALLNRMKPLLPRLKFPEMFHNDDIFPMTDSYVTINGIEVKENGWELQYTHEASEQQKKMTFSDAAAKHAMDFNAVTDGRSHAARFFADKIHQALADQFPDEYYPAKQQALDDAAAGGVGYLKYTGSAPLPVGKIYLRPIGAPIRDDTPGLGHWEVHGAGAARQSSAEKVVSVTARTCAV